MPWTNFIGPMTPILISCPETTAQGDTANKKAIIEIIIPLLNLFICHSSFLFSILLDTAPKIRDTVRRDRVELCHLWHLPAAKNTAPGKLHFITFAR
jgi:hypothetical protein